MRKPRAPQHIGRKRRLTGWTLITLGVIVAGVWVWSGWNYLRWTVASTDVLIHDGLVQIEGPSPQDSGYELINGEHERWFWRAMHRGGHTQLLDAGVLWRGYDTIRTEDWALNFVLWPIPLLLCLTAAPILRSGIIARRRATTNTCTTCGYSRAGLAAASPCPECGGKNSGDNQRREPH